LKSRRAIHINAVPISSIPATNRKSFHGSAVPSEIADEKFDATMIKPKKKEAYQNNFMTSH